MTKFNNAKLFWVCSFFLLANVCFAQTDPLYIDPSGKVGIGTNSPSTTLDVKGGLKATSMDVNGGIKATSMEVNGEVKATSMDVNGGIKTTSLDVNGGMKVSSLDVNGGLKATSLLVNDKVGIGTIPPAGKLHVSTNDSNGDVGAWGGGQFVVGQPGPNAGGIGLSYSNINNTGYISSLSPSVDWRDIGFRANNILFFASGSNEAMRVAQNGYLGIGTQKPIAPLHVDGYSFRSDQDEGYGYYENRNKIGNTGSGFKTKPISIYAATGILSGFGLWVASDLRIKKSVTIADTHTDLALVNKLKVVSYQHKDVFVTGTGLTIGFIAQEVEKTFPQAINTVSNFIPDIYTLSDYTKLQNKVLTVYLKNPHNLKSGDLVRVMTVARETKEVTVCVLDDHSFTVNDWTGESNKLFVYGKKVNDYKSVDYQQIFSLGISAIQELSKQVDLLRAENLKLRSDMQLRMSRLEEKLVELKPSPVTINK
ncbi:MAG: tail fiber domain-containing protein [Sphingobacteriaceae bacterium]